MSLLNSLTNIVSQVQEKVKQATPQQTTQAPSAQKTAYQQNMSSVQQPKQWDTRSVMGRIYELYDLNPERANEVYKEFRTLQKDKSSRYYNPYTSATNKAFGYMRDLGYDLSSVDDNWFSQNAEMKNWWTENSNDYGVKSLTKKSSAKEKLGYNYNQFLKAESNTKKAEQERAALDQELTYLAQNKYMNYSDEDIINQIDWKKYPTLAKMKAEAGEGQPVELNRAVDPSDAYNYGILWKARNNSDADMFSAIANSSLGNGKQWEKNDEIAAKLNKGDEATYAPYDVGMTMIDMGLYFGVDEFNDDTIADIDKTMDWNDETAVKNRARVIEANEFTKKCKEEKQLMYDNIDNLLKYTSNPDTIINAIFGGTELYKDLFALDDSLKTRKLKDTTSAINYRRQDVEAMIRDKCAKKKEATDQLVNAVVNGFTAGVRNYVEANNTKPPEKGQTLEQILGHPLTPPEVETPKPVGPVVDQEPVNVASKVAGDGTTMSSLNMPKLEAVYDSKYGTGAFKKAMKDPVNASDVLRIATELDTAENGAPPASIFTEPTGKTEPKAPPVFSENELAIEKAGKEAMEKLAPTIMSVGTKAEKVALETVKTPLFSKAVVAIKNAFVDRDTYFASSTDNVVKQYADGFNIIYDYDQHSNHINELQEKLDGLTPEWNALTERKTQSTSIRNLDEAEYRYLTDLTPDDINNFAAEMAQNEPNALRQLYAHVTGELPVEGLGPEEEYNAKLEQARQWWKFLTQKDQTPIDKLHAEVSQSADDTLEEGDEVGYTMDVPGTNGHTVDVTFTRTSDGEIAFVGAHDNLTGKSYGQDQQDEVNSLLGYSEFMSYDDEARLDELNRQKSVLESEIQKEKDYLAVNQSMYEEAKFDNAFLKASYTVAASMMGNKADKSLINKIEEFQTASMSPVNKSYFSNDIYDDAVNGGKYTREQVANVALYDAVDLETKANHLSDMLAYMDRLGVPVSDEQRKNVSDNLAELKKQAKLAGYDAIDGIVDYKGWVKKGKDKALSLPPSSELHQLARYRDSGDKMALTGMLAYNDRANALASIKPEEIDRCLAILSTDGEKKAKEYLDFMTDPNEGMLAVRSMNELQQSAYEFANQPGLNPYLATALGIGAKIVSWPGEMMNRAHNALTGQETSPYDPVYSTRVMGDALTSGSKDAILRVWGKDSFVGQLLTKTYDIGVGGAELAAGSEIMSGIFNSLGVPLEKLSSAFGTDTLSVKLAKSAAEVLPTTYESAEGTYRRVLTDTGDQTKAGLMYNVSLLSGLLTHSVVMNGIHNAYQTNPGALSSGIVGLIEKVITSDAAVGASTFASSVINSYADKAIMEADSKWYENYKRYSEEYPKAVAEQMADQQMWTDICNQTVESVVNNTLRTVTVAGVQAAGNKIADKLENVWKEIQPKYEILKAKVKGTYTEDVAETEGTTLFGDLANVPSSINKEAIPENAILNPVDGVNGTTVYDRETGKAHNIVAFMTTEKEDGTVDDIVFIDDQGEQIPFLKIATQRGAPASNLTEDEMAILGAGWNYGKTKYQAGVSTEAQAEAEATTTWPGEFTQGSVSQNTVSEGNGLSIVPTSPVVTNEIPQQPVTQSEALPQPVSPKEQQIIGTIYNASPESATIGIASILNTHVPEVDKAAAQTIVSDMSYGDTRVAAMVLQQITTLSPGEQTTDDVARAALSNGAGNQALWNAFEKTRNGQALTAEDVASIAKGLASDRATDPKAYNESIKNSVSDLRIANAATEIASRKENRGRIEEAEAKVASEKANLANTQNDVRDAEERKSVASGAAEDALSTLEQNPQDKENIANVQRTQAHLESTVREVQEKAKIAAMQEQKVKEEEKNLQTTQDEIMNAARTEAQAVIGQQQQAEAEEAYNTGITTVQPLEAFGHSIEVYDSNGNPVKITGIYDRVDTGNEARSTGLLAGGDVSLGRPDVVIMYTTEDGRLVMETPGKLDQDRNVIRGYGDVDTSESEEATTIADMSDRLVGNNANGSDSRHPDIRPEVYFPSSFPVNVNGKGIQMIGLAGKVNLDGEEYPVIMGMDGKLYTNGDENFELPYDYVDSVDDAFYDDVDNLPSINPEDVEKIQTTGGNVNADQERQEGSGQTGLSVQGAGGERNNAGELAGQPGSTDGFGSNGNVGSGTGLEGQTGRGTESTTQHIGQAESRGDEVLRHLIKSGLEESKSATDPGLRVADYKIYSSSLATAKEKSPYGLFVDNQSPEDLEANGAITLLSDDGMSGVAVETKGAKAGNIVGVFNNPDGGKKHTLPFLMTHAIARGGNKLDCYDGYLTESYEKFGFVPIAKVPWSDKYHRTINETTGEVTWDDGWNYERDGRPYIIVMAHNGDSPEVVAQRYKYDEKDGGYHRLTDEEMEKLPVIEDYEEALAVRDAALANRKNGKKLMAVHSQSIQNALASLKSGGWPAPSIAIGVQGQKNSGLNFGEVTFGFSRKTIDPAEDPRNRIFGNDAATPLFPRETIDFDKDSQRLEYIATGEPVSLHDIVETMYAKRGGDSKGTIVKEYNSVEEMIADSGRLVGYGVEAHLGTAFNEMFDLFEEIADGQDFGSNTLYDAYLKTTSYEEARKRLADEGINLTEEQLRKIEVAVDVTKEELTDYFEAKPGREVKNDESVFCLSPFHAKDKSDQPALEEMESLCEQIGIPVLHYDETDPNAKQRLYDTYVWAEDQSENSSTPTDENGNPVITPPTQPPVNDESTLPPVNNPPPANPSTPPNVTGGVSGRTGQHQWGLEGAQETDLLSPETKAWIKEHNEYLTDTNEAQLARAVAWVKSHANESDPTGLYGALAETESEDFNASNVDGQARVMTLLSMVSNGENPELEARLANLYNKAGQDPAQALQLRRMYRLMTPVGRKTTVINEVSKIEKEYQARGKKDLKLTVSQKVLDMAANAKTEEEFEEARRLMELELAAQIPSDLSLRMRTLRMTAMLANPRTHIRNLAGNGMAVPMVETKNVFGAVLERVGKVPVGQRTKSFGRTKESVAYAKEIVDSMMPELQGTAKYYASHSNAVERNRKAFGSGKGKTAVGRAISRTIGKGYQKFADWSSDKLEAEDKIFLKYHFVRALSGYMTANKLTKDKMKGKTKGKAIAYAIQEAQKATYRDDNRIATLLGSQTKKPAVAQFGIDAVTPFVKTPMNIAKRGLEYNVHGLVASLATSYHQLKEYKEWEDSGFKGPKPKHARSASEVYDKIAAGMTGTALATLGFALSSLGVLKVKAKPSEKLHGAQDYSIELDTPWGKVSIGIGNIIPANIPILFGASVQNEAEEMMETGDFSLGRWINAFGSTIEPLKDTTMLTSLNSMLEVSRYTNDGDVAIWSLVQKVLANYASSYVPSIVGAAAKVIDPIRRSTFTESGDPLRIWTSMFEQTQNKIPFLSRGNVPYVNAWGESDNLNPGFMDHFVAFMQNFVLPDKVQLMSDDELDNELQRIYDKSGVNVLPQTANKTLTINNEKVKLSDQQWFQYGQTRGQIAKSTLQELVERPEFIILMNNAEAQAKLVKDVYKYANAKAQLELFPDKKISDGWTKGALATDNVVDYIFKKEEESAKDTNISLHRKALVVEVNNSNMEAAQNEVAFLKRAGIENSSIMSSLTSQIKPLYREAYEHGDYDEMGRIEAFLQMLDIGYENTNFKKWLNDSNSLPEQIINTN